MGWTLLPCGCRMDIDIIDGQHTLIYEPHSLNCQYYKYMLAESEAQGNEVTIIDAS